MSLYILQYYPSSGDSIFDYFCVAIILVIIIGFLFYIFFMRQGSVSGKQTVIVKKPDKQKQEPDRRCPNCGRVIPFDAIICPYCERDFKK